MILTNLNAITSIERWRRETEPETPDVDHTQDTEEADRPEEDDGTHGLIILRRRRRRGYGPYHDERDQNQEQEDIPPDAGIEVDLSGYPDASPDVPDRAFARPVHHRRSPLEQDYMGRFIDEDA